MMEQSYFQCISQVKHISDNKKWYYILSTNIKSVAWLITSAEVNYTQWSFLYFYGKAGYWLILMDVVMLGSVFWSYLTKTGNDSLEFAKDCRKLKEIAPNCHH